VASLSNFESSPMSAQFSRPTPTGSPRGSRDDAHQASAPASNRQISLIESVAVELLGPIEMASFCGERRDAHPAAAPMAWPSLLTKEQLEAYLGMSWSTIIKVCPVAPVDVGANLVRYSRAQIDEWVSTLPARASNSRLTVIRRAEPPPDEALIDRRPEALNRVAARTWRLDRRR